MINFNSLEANQIWQKYLREKDNQEEAIRRQNRRAADKAYEAEEAQVEKELKYNSAALNYKKKKLAEFWDQTYHLLGNDVIFEASPDLSTEKLQAFEHYLEQKQLQAIRECIELDQHLKQILIQNNGVLIDDTSVSSQSFQQYEDYDEEEEEREDYVAKTAHTVQMIDFLKYKRASEGPKIIQKSSNNLSTNRQSTIAENTGLKYISRRDKVARLMTKSTVYSQPLAMHTQMSHPTSRSPAQQIMNFPEEQAVEVQQEQRFVTNFEFVEEILPESPQRLSVNMQRTSPEKYQENLRMQHHIQKSRINNDPTFEEKNNIKRMMNNYRQSEKVLQSLTQQTETDEEDPPIQRPPPDAFRLTEDIGELSEDVNESFIDRLNEKFKNAYDEVNNRRPIVNNQGKQKATHKLLPHPEIPFVQDDTIKDSQLISSLMSPHHDELTQVEQRTGPLAFSVRDVRSQGSVTTEPFETLMASPVRESPKKPGVNNRNYEHKAKHKESPKKREVMMNSLFESFDQEFMKRDYEIQEEAEVEKEQDLEIDSNKHLQTPKSSVKEQKRSIIDVNEAEDFIMELTRLVNQGNGVIPSKCQSKLSELMTNATLSKPNNTKSKVAANIKSKSVPRKNNKPELSAYLDSIGAGLSAKYFDVIKAKLSAGVVRHGWEALLALFASFDKTVPTNNSKLNINDETLNTYLGQPGKIIVHMRKLSTLLSRAPLSQDFLNDFYNSFAEFCECVAGVQDWNDHPEFIPFIKYLYFTRRFVDDAIASGEIKVKKEEKQQLPTRRANEEYLRQAQKKKDEGRSSVHTQHRREEEDAFGINFAEWEHNLEEIERENRELKHDLKVEEIKKIHEENQQKKLEEKERLAQELEVSKEEHLKIQQLEKEKQQREKAFKHDKFTREAKDRRALREHMKQQKKELEKMQIDQTLEELQFKNQKDQERREQKKVEIQNRTEKIRENKKAQINNQLAEKHQQKEERVWDKAQKLLIRQRELLSERESLNRAAKTSHK